MPIIFGDGATSSSQTTRGGQYILLGGPELLPYNLLLMVHIHLHIMLMFGMGYEKFQSFI